MENKEYLNPDELFPSLPYGFSQVVTSQGGKLVFMSGQVAWDADMRLLGGMDLQAQAMHSLRNVERAVQAAGGSLQDVVSLRIYIVDYKLDESESIQAALKTIFPTHRAPASTWIGVRALAHPDFLVEIEATAVIEP